MTECNCESKALAKYYRHMEQYYRKKSRMLRKQCEHLLVEVNERRKSSEEATKTLSIVASEIRAAHLSDIDPTLRQRLLMPIRKVLNDAPPLTVVKD